MRSRSRAYLPDAWRAAGPLAALALACALVCPTPAHAATAPPGGGGHAPGGVVRRKLLPLRPRVGSGGAAVEPKALLYDLDDLVTQQRPNTPEQNMDLLVQGAHKLYGAYGSVWGGYDLGGASGGRGEAVERVSTFIPCAEDSCGHTPWEEARFRQWSHRGPREPGAFSSQGSGRKLHVFVVSPAYHGSTAVYGLLSTSPHVSTLAGHGNWAGEGAWLWKGTDLEKYFHGAGWKHDYNMSAVRDIYRRYWDMTKPILVDKSPIMNLEVDKMREEFSKDGDVRFVFVVRSPCLQARVSWKIDSRAKSVRENGGARCHGRRPRGHWGWAGRRAATCSECVAPSRGAQDWRARRVELRKVARTYYLQMANIAKVKGEALVLRHEDVLMRTGDAIRALLDFIPELESLDSSRLHPAFEKSMSKDKGKDSRINARFKPLDAYKRGSCTRSKRACVEGIYGPVMDFFGY